MDKASRHIWLGPVLTWAALCALLALTASLAYVPLGEANLTVSLVIAGLKAALIGAVFMRLSRSDNLNRLAAAAGPIWIFILLFLIGADYLTR
jgi:cytochrome c oxidase subunit 4